MLGNWLSSRTVLWVILSHALVRSIFSVAFQWGEGTGTGQSLENRNRMPSVGVKCPLSLLSRESWFRGCSMHTFPSSLIFTPLVLCLFVSGTCKPDGISTDILICVGWGGGCCSSPFSPCKGICPHALFRTQYPRLLTRICMIQNVLQHF